MRPELRTTSLRAKTIGKKIISYFLSRGLDEHTRPSANVFSGYVSYVVNDPSGSANLLCIDQYNDHGRA